jgi:pimeloyl-ACP methyl ester carboxylesterase
MVDDHVKIEIIADVGHFLHLETPDAINQRILEFLS